MQNFEISVCPVDSDTESAFVALNGAKIEDSRKFSKIREFIVWRKET